MTKELIIDEVGRIELPSEIVEKRHIGPGQRIRFEEKPDGTLTLHIGRKLRDLVGVLDCNGIHLSIEQINEAIESKGLNL
ncbi:MAG: hypothetical protein FJY65_12125 [Calditrichaeota bacterium]|nr:hypothetical protein [Calditrichota bacterium]